MATTVYSERSVASGSASSIAEAAGGIALIVLAIIGLGGVRPDLLTEIGTIVLGAALLTEGAAVVSGYAQVLSGTTGETIAMGSSNGLMSEIFIGGAILVLGILAIIGVAAATLTAVAVLAAGALMLISAPMMTQFAEIRRQVLGVPESVQPLLRASASSVSGLQVLGGLAAIVLGILGLTTMGGAGTGYDPTLTLVALLILGAALTFNGTALTASMMRLFSR